MLFKKLFFKQSEPITKFVIAEDGAMKITNSKRELSNKEKLRFPIINQSKRSNKFLVSEFWDRQEFNRLIEFIKSLHNNTEQNAIHYRSTYSSGACFTIAIRWLSSILKFPNMGSSNRINKMRSLLICDITLQTLYLNSFYEKDRDFLNIWNIFMREYIPDSYIKCRNQQILLTPLFFDAYGLVSMS
jgi:hypothetical protein